MSNEDQRGYMGVMGQDVSYLLSQLDDHIANPIFRNDLKQSLQRLSDLKFALDESSIVAVTDRSGKIQYVNDKFCEISKYSRDELLGQDHRIINSKYHDRDFMKNLWRTIASGKVWHGEIRNKAKDGTYYWVKTTIVPLLDEHHRPRQYLAIRNEVTRMKRVEEELQHMMSKVMQIQEEERKRFSRELHDGIGQSLFSLLIQLDRMISEREDPELEQRRQDVSRIMEEVRGLAWELRPSVLDDLGVVPALRTYIENVSQHYGMRIHFDCDLRGRLDAQQETTIYRMIQEALINAAKYADTSEVSVILKEGDTSIEARVEDEGKGFIRDRNSKGVGLFSMEERARSVDGKMSIVSKPGQGTKVILTIPKSPKK